MEVKGHKMLNIGGKYSLSQSRGCGLLVFSLKKFFRLEAHSLRANSIPAIELLPINVYKAKGRQCKV